jgi:hypothetical protein
MSVWDWTYRCFFPGFRMGLGLKEKRDSSTPNPTTLDCHCRGPWAVGDAVFDVLFKKSHKERKDRQTGRQAGKTLMMVFAFGYSFLSLLSFH